MRLLTSLAVLTSVSFFAYGVSCLASAWMRAEFARYGLARYRSVTGWLEILGAVGILAGLKAPAIGVAAAAGLMALMIGAVAVRIRIRDTLLQALPALIYLALTVYLAAKFALAIDPGFF